MRAGRHSRTAEAAAALRAMHRAIDGPVIFDDPYAIELTSRGWRRRLQSAWLLRGVARDPLGFFSAMRGHVIGRARFAEDHLAQALHEGVRQYLVIGAGFDSFSLRFTAAPENFGLFELDHPSTQAEKRRRLSAYTLPDWVHYIPVDFEAHQLAQALTSSAIDARQPLFISWLGTTPYLTREAILATLQTLAKFSRPGSRLVMDFSTAHRGLALGRGFLRGAALLAYTHLAGEPLIDHGLSRQEFVDQCARLGWQPQVTLDSHELARRYFDSSRPRLSCIEGSCFGVFERSRTD